MDYDTWKLDSGKEEESPVLATCRYCRKELYQDDFIFAIDGGICEECLIDGYRERLEEER